MLIETSILLLFATIASSQDVDRATDIPERLLPERSLRLPNTTFPLRYHLHILTNIHREIFDYSGNVTLDILIKESTNEIVLHAKKLQDFVVKVTESTTGDVLKDIVHTYDTAASFLIIHPSENYQAFEAGQEFRVEILYKGIMNTKTLGIYWLTYNDNDNKTVYLAATQFEPTSARYAFPCYDEPAFKSNFTISITHGSNYTAISNMPVNGDPIQDADNMITTTFLETPPMSTYLVAFVISNFEHISEEYRGVTQRVFTAPNTVNKGLKALRNAVHTVAALEDYLGIRYSLAKLDHIALKKNFGAAMENWGLITYKEDSLLDNDSADVHKKLKDLLTQNHEIVHQWFGNLVSPEWWTYAWLNEGFATYFSYIVTDMVHPEHKAMEFFLTDIAEPAFYSYSITVRPMTHYVEKESEILSVFDYVTYQKAACVIKMFHHAFDQNTFVRGLHKFLSKAQYTVANEDQLFEALQEAINENGLINARQLSGSVHDIMVSWTHSELIPYVSVTSNYETNTITIRQRSKDANSTELWWIPLNFATASQPDFESTQADYFMPPVAEVTLHATEVGIKLQPHDWLIVNKQQTGFYHMLYEDDNLLAIARQLQQNHTAIHPLNRAAIFKDLSSLLENNEINSVDVIFELLKYMQYEQDYMPWNSVADVVDFFKKNLFDTPTLALYNEFIQRLIAPIFRKLQRMPLTNLTNTEFWARQQVMDMACMADLPECLEFTRKSALEYILNHKDLQESKDFSNPMDSTLCLGLRHVSDEEFNAALDQLKKADRNSVWYDEVIYSIYCTQSRVQMRKYLEVLVGENSTHSIMDESESMMYLFFIYKMNRVARTVVWNFFEENYKILCRSPFFTDNFNRISEYVASSHRQQFLTLHHLIADEVKCSGSSSLINDHSKRIGKKMQRREMFLNKFGDKIQNWLEREQAAIVRTASIGARNQASRIGNPFKFASKLFRKLLKINKKYK